MRIYSSIAGIDFGLNNSLIAIFSEDGNPLIVPDSSGSFSIPSVVAFPQEGQPLVGLIAKHQAITNPKNTIFFIKCFLGRHFDDLADEQQLVQYDLAKAPSGEAYVKIDSNFYSPQQISAMILSQLKANVKAHFGTEITQCVISIPSNFTPRQCNALEEAAQLANLQIMRFVHDPIAAALGFISTNRPSIFVIFEFTSNRCNVNILECVDGCVAVKVPRSDLHLGGNDFDEKITGWMVEQLKKQHGIDISSDKMAIVRLKEAAKKAKHELSSSEDVQICLPYINNSIEFNATLTSDVFQNLAQPLINRSINLIDRCMFDADLRPSQIDDVLLLGGAAQMPLLQQGMQEYFSRKPKIISDPSHAKAIGAVKLAWKYVEENQQREQEKQTSTKYRSDKEKLKYYSSILELDDKLTPSEIKKHYRAIVSQYHPDKVHHLGKELRDLAERKSKEINEAYDYFKNKLDL